MNRFQESAFNKGNQYSLCLKEDILLFFKVRQSPLPQTKQLGVAFLIADVNIRDQIGR
jgi:hypothetical protein